MESGISGRCFHDSLDLHDGATVHSPTLASLCGDKGGVSTLRTTDNALLIRFISDESVQKQGFSIKLDLEKCGGSLYGLSGSFSSPLYPQNYPSQSDCIWNIHAPTGHYISILFKTFDLSGRRRTRNNCRDGEDVVKIYDGTNTTENNLIRSLCGNLGSWLPYRVNSSDSSAVVRFTSNNDRDSATGFEATFTSSIEGKTNSNIQLKLLFPLLF